MHPSGKVNKTVVNLGDKPRLAVNKSGAYSGSIALKRGVEVEVLVWC